MLASDGSVIIIYRQSIYEVTAQLNKGSNVVYKVHSSFYILQVNIIIINFIIHLWTYLDSATYRTHYYVLNFKQ